MAWTTPPTFVDGNMYSAAQLNVLSNDLAELWGMAQGPNTPFLSMYSQGISLDANNNLWYLRYQLPYMHYKARCIDYGVTSFTLRINGSTVYSDATDYTGGHTYQGYVTLSSLGLTLGNLYPVNIVAPLHAFAHFYVDGFIQSADTATPF